MTTIPRDLRPGYIADPVHGYIFFTSIERLLFRHRVAQRLRHISQTGPVHLVYPEVTTSRFSHSLGAMHLVSNYLFSALRNTDPGIQTRVATGLRSAITKIATVVVDLHHIVEPLRKERLLAYALFPADIQPLLLIAEQSLRLAALFHDLGHLPLSHDFEYGLEKYWRGLQKNARDQSPLASLMENVIGESKIHERLGHGLSLMLLKELYPEVENTPYHDVVRVCFMLAQQILEHPETQDSNDEDLTLSWLHSVIDGELDVDRFDYLLRDGRNYGFEFADYDVNRLLTNLTIVPIGAGFLTGIRVNGLSALESFFLSRFRSYQNGIRHHKVSQADTAAEYCVARILRDSNDSSVETFSRDLARIGPLAGGTDYPDINTDERQPLLQRFADYDDPWWITTMRIYGHRWNDEWLNLVCWRQPGPRSLWKRRPDFPTTQSLRIWNSRLPQPSDLDGQGKWFQVCESLEQEGVLVKRHYFRPWKTRPDGAESSLQVDQGNGTLKSVTELSPLIRGLRDAWADDVQVYAFATSTCALTGEEVVNRLQQAMKEEN